MVENELLVYALSIGIAEETFWELTPRKFKIYDRAFRMKLKRIDENNFMLGKYMQIAIASSITKDNVYPEQPLLREYYEDMELTEKEREEKELKKMLYYEELWHNNDIQLGLPETDIK